MRIEEPKAIAHIRRQDVTTDQTMKGKTVLFTGASRGMGRLVAIELARRGAEVLVVGHNQARGAAAVDAIRATGSSAQFLCADMGDAEEVCVLAEAVLARAWGDRCADPQRGRYASVGRAHTRRCRLRLRPELPRRPPAHATPRGA